MNGWEIDARVLGALIGATVVLLGWLVAWARERWAEQRRRAERIRDIQIALSAEIRAYVAVLERDDLKAFSDGMVQRMRANPTFVPFIPHEKNDTVFQSIVAEIHVLPEDCVDPVVVYYSQVVAIAALIADMRTSDYAALPMDRRIDVYRHYISLKEGARDWGNEALRLMKAHIRQGDGGLALAGRQPAGGGA